MPYLALIYLAVINLAAYAAFASDKRRAIEGEGRIPERMLLRLAMFGGTPGALAAQQSLRHKTRKQPFKTQLWMVAAAQAAASAALAWSVLR